jgi:hypothetical protein
MVAHTETFLVSDHPVSAPVAVASRHFRTGAATPPLEELNMPLLNTSQ